MLNELLARVMKVDALDFRQYSIDNRKLWDGIPQDIADQIVGEAEAADPVASAYIPLSLFRLFKKTGDRVSFEKVYFAKRRMLSNLVLAECLEDKGRFLARIEEAVWALLSEPAWVIHAHNGYIRDTEQLDTPLTERPILDLFACETGEILALTRACLRGRLNPLIDRDIVHALKTRIVEPYITDSFWWMGSSGPLNNWSPWCTQNVLIAAMSLEDLSQKERFKVMRQAIATLDAFIDSYGPDGGCDEGASYYHAAALAMDGAFRILEAATGVDFSPLYAQPKIGAMAYFVEAVHVADDIYLNYADCSPKAGRLKAREYLFAKRTGKGDMMHHAAIDYIDYGWREEDNDYNLFYMLTGLSLYQEILKEYRRHVDFAKPRFLSFGKTQMGIWRTKGVTFALKGGCNAESHNHNDVGSIIAYLGDRPLLVDIGVETYTKTTFSPQRYTLKPMQSGYHNVVNFPPIEQKDGEQYRAEEAILTEDGASMDLTKAYAADGRLKSYRRRLAIDDKAPAFTITEEIEVDGLEPVLTLMSLEEPRPAGRNMIDYDSFTIRFDRDVEISTEPFPVTDERLRKAWPELLYRTLVRLPGTTVWTLETSKETEK